MIKNIIFSARVSCRRNGILRLKTFQGGSTEYQGYIQIVSFLHGHAYVRRSTHPEKNHITSTLICLSHFRITHVDTNSFKIATIIDPSRHLASLIDGVDSFV